MVDLICQEFFTRPNHPLQRQYEALRSIFVDRRFQKEVAAEFGYQYDSLRFRTRAAGVFLFLPFLAQMQPDSIVREADYSGTKMIPSDAAILSLLVLKL